MAKFREAAGRLGKLIKSHGLDVRRVILLAVIAGLLNLSLPLGIQAVINFLNAGELSTSWGVLVVFVLLGITLVGVLQVRQLRVTELIEQKIFADAALDIAHRLPRTKLGKHGRLYMPELINRFFEIVTVQKGLSKILVDFSGAGIQIVFGLILLSLYHPLFIVFGIVLISLLYITISLTGRPGLITSLEESKYKYQVAHWLEEVGRASSTFKLVGHSQLPLQRTDEHVMGYLKARNKHFRILTWQYTAMIAFKISVAASLLILGSILVIDRQINIGQFVASEIIIVMTIGAVEKLVFSFQTIYDMLTALEKLGTINDLEIESSAGTDVRVKNEKGLHVRMENLSFRYRPDEPPLINNFSAELLPGKSYCITGKSGSGRSTLMKLITGLYDEFEGHIIINDLPLNSLNKSSLRRLTGDNFTESDVFLGSISENIIAGRSGISEDTMLEASKQVGLHSFVEKLKMGYDTEVEPEGRGLSTTLRQLILLTRAVAGQPSLMLLEEQALPQEPELRKRVLDLMMADRNPWTLLIAATDPEILSRCENQYQLT